MKSNWVQRLGRHGCGGYLFAYFAFFSGHMQKLTPCRAKRRLQDGKSADLLFVGLGESAAVRGTYSN